MVNQLSVGELRVHFGSRPLTRAHGAFHVLDPFGGGLGAGPVDPSNRLAQCIAVTDPLSNTIAERYQSVTLSHPGEELSHRLKEAKEGSSQSKRNKLIVKKVTKNLRTRRRSSIENVVNKDIISSNHSICPTKNSNSDRLSDFTFLETIGVGCFGKVKLAKWNSCLERPCALKIVNKEYAAKLKQIDHLISEREILINIDNPYVVKWYLADLHTYY